MCWFSTPRIPAGYEIPRQREDTWWPGDLFLLVTALLGWRNLVMLLGAKGRKDKSPGEKYKEV